HVDLAHAMALTSDGHIVVAGSAEHGGTDMAVAEYTSSGALETSFGSGGTVTVSYTGSTSSAKAMVLQDDGKIVLAGSAANVNFPVNSDFAAARLNADGSLDSGFGTGGMVTTDMGDVSDGASAS